MSTQSIRRWTNSGKLRTYRSAGNHRRIKTSDLMKLIDKEPNFVVDPPQSYLEFLGDDITPDPTKVPRLRDLHKYLEEYSTTREGNEVSSTIKF